MAAGHVSLGLLFPGQGSQWDGMLPWLDAGPASQQALAPMQRRLGADWRAHAHDAAWLRRNDVAQCLLTGLGLAAWQVLQPMLPAPAAMAGYSVGELAAFSAAGVFDTDTALQLAGQRAAIMDDGLQGVDTGLLSISGIASAAIERLCQTHDLDLAIRTGADRCLVGGLRSHLVAAERDATLAGATCTLLAVPLASHTRWLAAGVAPLAAALQVTAFAAPHTPLVVGVTGQVERRPSALRDALSAQIASTIRWDRCMETLAERGLRCVLEMGPGSALAKMWNARFPGVQARSVDEFQAPSGISRWVADTLACG